MKTLDIIIEKGKDGYGAYLNEVTGITGFGETIEDAKESIRDAIVEYIDYCKEENIAYEAELENPSLLQFKYKFDLQTVFEHFSMINVSDLAEKIGMNASLLRRYKTGSAFASEKQKNKIEKTLHEIGDELLHVQL